MLNTGLIVVSKRHFPIILTSKDSLFIVQHEADYMHVIYTKQILFTPTHITLTPSCLHTLHFFKTI